ncbi:unnamed protein product [Schistosoma margrebowiei]|uniref:Uncharacterized protein n=1 Tax=Schistosoma margrebowiei TaxID=48269 RepID=A0A183LQQ3_9TREM|nr:unnamed protein product [Schistosoma margrebowiei]
MNRLMLDHHCNLEVLDGRFVLLRDSSEVRTHDPACGRDRYLPQYKGKWSPYIRLSQPMRNLTRSIGAKGTFYCDILGEPIPQFQWYKNGEKLLEKPNKIKITTALWGSALRVEKLHNSDIGQYLCVATNPSGTLNATAYLQLTSKKITLSTSKFPGVELLPGDSLSDLEYTDDIILFGEDADKMQSLLTTLSNNASMFRMRFSPSKCKMLLQDRVASTLELMIGSEVIERVDRSTYLASLISPSGLVCEEISSRIQKARLASANLRHLWRRQDIHLSTKGRVY